MESALEALCADQNLLAFEKKFHQDTEAGSPGLPTHYRRFLVCFTCLEDADVLPRGVGSVSPHPYGHIWGLNLQTKFRKSPVTFLGPGSGQEEGW